MNVAVFAKLGQDRYRKTVRVKLACFIFLFLQFLSEEKQSKLFISLHYCFSLLFPTLTHFTQFE